MKGKKFLKEEFELVKLLFSDLEVSFTRKGNIKINKPNDKYTWYVLGFNKYGFWVRRYHYSDWWRYHNHMQLNVTRLNMKQDNNGNYHYTFDNFDKMLNYFGNLVYSNKISF